MWQIKGPLDLPDLTGGIPDANSWLMPVDVSDEDIFADTGVFSSPIEGQEGDDLHQASYNVCAAQMPECAAEMDMLRLMYSQQIRSDCAAYENSLKQQRNASAQKLYTAEQALRSAALEQYQSANKYDLGQCVVEFKNCMIDTGGCGSDFSGCASVAAFDAVNSRGNREAEPYSIKGAISEIEIKASTYDILYSKKPLCESVTKQCVTANEANGGDQVWLTFLQEIAPQVKSAELIAEDNVRQNCIGNISSCFQQACKDTMDPNDPDGSYDMCLSRPETMLSLCTVPLNACGITVSGDEVEDITGIWGFVKARLASMRVDACTNQVKECLQSENRCGEDYAQCIGLDIESISAMCPVELLTACQTFDAEGNAQFTDMAQIDNVIQGIYLSIDNALLEQCQKTVTDKMIELCGDTSTCYAFDDDTIIGTESLASYRDNNGDYVIEGLISFGNLQVDKVAKDSENNSGQSYNTYEINISNYREHLNDTDPTTMRVVSALESVASKIEQKIAILRQDPTIQMCVEGRNMSQIRRGAGTATARFPYLLDSSIMAIVASGLDRAKTNYDAKYNELVNEALEEQNDQVKAVLCASMASDGAPQCAEYVTNRQGEAICSSYEAPFMEDIFINSGAEAKTSGIIGDDMYATKYVISGAKISDLASVQSTGHSDYIQTDSKGNMVGRIAMSAVYSSETNECTITTTTTMCDSLKEIITTDTYNKTTCGSGGLNILGGGGCTGAGGILNIGGGKKTTISTRSENFEGVACQSFMDPITVSTKVKM